MQKREGGGGGGAPLPPTRSRKACVPRSREGNNLPGRYCASCCSTARATTSCRATGRSTVAAEAPPPMVGAIPALPGAVDVGTVIAGDCCDAGAPVVAWTVIAGDCCDGGAPVVAMAAVGARGDGWSEAPVAAIRSAARERRERRGAAAEAGGCGVDSLGVAPSVVDISSYGEGVKRRSSGEGANEGPRVLMFT